MQSLITTMLSEYQVWKVRFSYKVRALMSACFHFFLRCTIAEFRASKAHSTLISNATYSPWRVDPTFCELQQKIMAHSLLDTMRLYELWQLVYQVKSLAGDVIEVGSWRGGSGCLLAARIAQNSTETRVFLCDTFQGIVKAGLQDRFYSGAEFSNSCMDTVIHLAQRLNLSNITILPGIFPEDTGEPIQHHLFKFVHIDVDVYQSARDAFEWLFPKLVHGAVVVFDDYGSASTPGIRQYVDELQEQEDLTIIRNLNGQAVVVKR